jgi:hypothetical protein
MPLLTAQKHQWTKQPPYNFYHFPEEHRAGWTIFWEEMDGDLEKIAEFAEKSDVECPCEWLESLHRFLFGTFSGESKLMKTAAEGGFPAFVKQTIKNHKDDPKERDWYSVRGITHDKFLGMLERAAEIIDPRQSVAFINARVKDLGFFLYSEFVLAKTKGKSEIKSIASDLNKKAYNLESTVLGESPINGLNPGTTVLNALLPGEFFMVTEVVRTASDDIESLVTRDTKGKVAFMKDLWNVQVP